MSFAKKGAKTGKGANRQDKVRDQEKAQIYEEFEGQDLDSVKSDFTEALDVSIIVIKSSNQDSLVIIAYLFTDLLRRA